MRGLDALTPIATACAPAWRRTRRIRWRRRCSAAIRDAVDRDRARRAASTCPSRREEIEFIRTGGGPWRALLEDVGVVGSGLGAARRHAGRVSSTTCGFLDGRAARRPRRADDRSPTSTRLAARGATLVTCPRSNGHTGAGAPPIERLLRLRRRGGGRHRQPRRARRISTCSPSWPTMRRAGADGVRRARCSTARRAQGARALGFDADYGTIEPGKSRPAARRRRSGRR